MADEVNPITCICTQPGMCERRGCMIPGIHFRKCQAGHALAIDRLYSQKITPTIGEKIGPGPVHRSEIKVASASSDTGTQSNRKTGCLQREKVGTELKAIISGLMQVKSTGGCGCGKLATQMDAWGIAGCEQHRDEIVAALVSNRDVLEESLRNNGETWKAKAAHYAPESVLKIGAEWLLDKAIDNVRTANAIEAERRKLNTKNLKASQVEWRDPALSDTSGQSWERQGTWTSDIRHLTFHLWPTKKTDSWKWNLTQLSARWSLFNGVKIIAIATDAATVDAKEVIEFADSLGIRFDHVVARPNSKTIREVATWLPMLSILKPESAGPNEVVFSCHGKGVRHDANHVQIDRWAQCMYESCLDYWSLVDAQLSSHLATGSFKRYGNFQTPGNHRWHYSGTFFWWRLAEIGKRNWRKVDQQFFGTESWLGHQCKPSETGVLFCDHTQDLYQSSYWRNEVDGLWETWKQNARLLMSGN